MTSRAPRSSLRHPLILSLLAGAFLWARPAAAQPAPETTAPPAEGPATPAPVAPPVTPPAATVPPPATPAPAEAKAPKDESKKKGNDEQDAEDHGKGDPRAPDKGPKAPGIGGEKGPVLAASAADENKYGEIEIHGRVFARASLSTRETPGATPTATRTRINALDLSVPTARFSLDYQSPLKWLSAQLEGELTSRNVLRDAFVRARKRWVTVKAGHFKVPISALALESRFSLPTVDRGLLHDYLLDVLQIGDRRFGTTVELHDRDVKTGLRPTLTLGAFQGSALDQGAFRDIEDETLGGQSYAARVELKPGDLVFGASFEHRVGPEVTLVVPEGGVPELRRPSTCKPPCVAHYWTVGADATLDTEFSTGGLRLWLDALAGRSWIESSRKRLDPARAEDGAFPTFGALRGVVAYRFGGTSRRDLYFEPYGMAGVLDPDLAYGRDHVTEWMLGVNVGRWKVARVGLEGVIHRGAARLPAALGGDPDRMSLMLQAALAF